MPSGASQISEGILHFSEAEQTSGLVASKPRGYAGTPLAPMVVGGMMGILPAATAASRAITQAWGILETALDKSCGYALYHSGEPTVAYVTPSVEPDACARLNNECAW